MKPYYQLSKKEKLALSNEDLIKAIKLEAIERGIKPPLTLEGAINQGFFATYNKPSDAVCFYEICIPNEYGSNKEPSGVAYKTKEAAERAMEGAIRVEHDNYASKQNKLIQGEFCAQTVWVSLNGSVSISKKIDEYTQDDTEFNALTEEIMSKQCELKQEEYNTKVNAQKRGAYLELAQGNEDIAKAFWMKTEKTEWPVITDLA